LTGKWRVLDLGPRAPEWWDEKLSSFGPVSPRQTAAWARYSAGLFHSRPSHLALIDQQDRIKALLQVLRDGWLVDDLIRYPALAGLRRLTERCLPVLSWRGGPSLAPGVSLDQVWPLLWRHLAGQVFDQGLVGVQSTVLAGFSGPAFPTPLRPGPENWRAQGTILVEVAATEEAQWRLLKQAARKAINKCRRQEVRVRRLENLAEVRRYGQLFNAHRVQLGLAPASPRYFPAIWRHLAGQVSFYLAEHQGNWAAGLGVWHFGGVIEEFASFRDEAYCRDLGLNPGDLIKWEILRWGAGQGYLIYDLAGVPAQPGGVPGLQVLPSSPKEVNIRRFKEKWGGGYIDRPMLFWSGPVLGRLAGLIQGAFRASVHLTGLRRLASRARTRF